MVALRDLLLGGPGHDGYAYCADVYCVECGQAIVRELHAAGKLPATTEECDDTDVCPCPIFFGESDCEQHCCNCGEFLYGVPSEE